MKKTKKFFIWLKKNQSYVVSFCVDIPELILDIYEG